MKYCNYLIALILFIMAGCQSGQVKVISSELSRKNFYEKIVGTGTLESANNSVIATPRIPSNSIKIVELGEDGTVVQPGDTVCILEANDIQSQFDLHLEGLEKLNADLIKLEASNAVELSLLNATLEEFKASKRLSRLDSLQMLFTSKEKSQIKILEERINEIQQQKTIRKMEAQNRINEQSVRALKSQIIQKKQIIQQTQDLIDKLVLTAPAQGMLIRASLPSRITINASGEMTTSGGGQITPGTTARIGMPLVQLPDLDSMQVVLMLQEAEYKRVKVGHKVEISPESHPEILTTGTVKSKSLASQPLAYPYKVKSYKVIIDIDSLDHFFLPGLSTDCELIVQEIMDTIVTPSIAIFETDSLKFVYVERNGLFEKQEIETGTSNTSETIVVKGLKGNETIALLEPPLNLIRKIEIKKNE